MSMRVATRRTVYATVIAAVSGFAQLALAERLGPEKFGQFVFATGLVFLGHPAAMFLGMPPVVIRLFALEQTPAGRRVLIAWVMRLALFSSTIVTAILMGSLLLGAEGFGMIAVVALFSLPILARSSCNGSSIIAAGRADLAVLTNQLAPSLAFVLSLAGIAVGIFPPEAMTLLVVWICGQLVAFGLSRRARRDVLEWPAALEQIPEPTEKQRTRWMASGRLVWMATVFGIAAMSIDVVLLGFLSDDPKAVGNYGLAVRVLFLAQIGAQAAVVAFGPALSRNVENGAWKEVSRDLMRARVFALACVVPCFLAALFFLAPLLARIAPAYMDAVVPAQLMMGMLVLMSAVGPLGIVMQAAGRERSMLVVNILVLVSMVVCAITLIPGLGLLGAVFAWMSAQATRALGILFVAARFYLQRRTSLVGCDPKMKETDA
jgi:O-antigen/teichoic acid export membrane protein